MSEFTTYLTLGFHHISDLNAYDHILFIVALCAVYEIHQWRRILILVTAFTLGHSVTLALATLGWLPVPAAVIEFLIPVTIFLTALLNAIEKVDQASPRKMYFNYGLAMFFGLIHGMGFSNYLRMLLGQEESIVTPLFAFNVGLELGQLLVVACVFAVAVVAMNLIRIQHREWNLFVSGGAAGIALILMNETRFW